MKKILVILAVLFAVGATTSCQKTTNFEYSELLTVDNYDLTIPKTASKKGVNGESLHYFCITATGPWEATLVQQTDDEIWCWLHDHYTVAKKDEDGNTIKDEYGRVETESIPVAEGVEYFNGTEKYCTVRGKAGVTYLPMEYQDNQSGVVRYATFRVRRLDMDYEKFVNITQNK